MKLTQKFCIATTAGVVMSLGLLKAVPAHAVTLNFDWTGNAGYSARGSASNNTLDMWKAIRLTALIHKGTTLDPTAVPAKTVLRMATLGGAEALGLSNKIGAIKVGLQADLIQVQLKEPHLLPLYDVISHLVYAADAQDVDTVIVNGQVLMEKRKMLTVDTEQIRREATSIAQRIKAEFRPSN